MPKSLHAKTIGLIAVIGVAMANTVSANDSANPLAEPRVDLRPRFEQYKLSVRQQGRRGACQVMAMVGVMEFHLARRGKPVDLSEQFLMWAANKATDRNRVQGFNPDLLIAGLKHHGICEESLMRYVPRNDAIAEPSAAARINAKSRRSCTVVSIKHWSSEIGFSEKDMAAIARWLSQGSPVTATLCWPEGIDMGRIVDANDFLIDQKIDGQSKNGHGVILVGFGIDEHCPGGGYFLFRNSWGPRFGDSGYAKVSFEFARKYGTDAYIVSVE